MNNQPHISTISGMASAPPSYVETFDQHPPSKNYVPVPPPMPQPYTQQPPMGYYQATTNYQGYNAPQQSYNPPITVNATLNNTPESENVNVVVVKRKNNSVCCYCFKWVLFFAIISVVVVVARFIINEVNRAEARRRYYP